MRFLTITRLVSAISMTIGAPTSSPSKLPTLMPTGSPNETSTTHAPTNACFTGDNWKDNYGTTCTWYENNESKGCPTWSQYPGDYNLTAGEACCHCQVDPGQCYIKEQWIDDAGYGCSWYEDNEPEGCPKYYDYPGKYNLTAGEACCHCQVDSVSPTPPPTPGTVAEYFFIEMHLENFDIRCFGPGPCNNVNPEPYQALIDCDGSNETQWMYSEGDKMIHSKADSSLCLFPFEHPGAGGHFLKLNDCSVEDVSGAFEFYNDNTIRHSSGKCLGLTIGNSIFPKLLACIEDQELQQWNVTAVPSDE